MASETSPLNPPSRLVLENVPRVSFFCGGERAPEDVPFPSCVRACLEYLGDDLGGKPFEAHGKPWRLDLTYTRVMAVSGCAFRLSWKPGWHGDNVAVFLVSDDPAAVFHRGLEAVGYTCELVHKGDCGGEGYFRERIIESIRRGRPLIAHGIIGPPEDCVVTGYDEGGDVLIGWSFFQAMPGENAGVEFEPSGYFRKRNWYENTWSLCLLGERVQRPTMEDLCRKTLDWALQVVLTPKRYGDRHNGLAAYEAWADHLLRDEDFPADDMPVLRLRMGVHDDAVGTVAEGRWYAGQFLKHAAEQMPRAAEPLLAAAACYDAEHDLMWKVWGCVGGNGRDDAKVRQLAEPAMRRQIVPLILQARDKDAEAAEHLRRALGTLG